MDAPRLNVIGCGRAAGTLALLWRMRRLVRIGAVLNRTAESAQAAVARLGQGIAANDYGDFPEAPLWLIGVPDTDIEGVAGALAASGRAKPGDVAFHLAGTHGPRALRALSAAGLHVASVHPWHAFSGDPDNHGGGARSGGNPLAGSHCVAEGDSVSLAALQPLFEAIGCDWIEASISDRARYHAAAVLVSNAPRALLSEATRWLQHVGLPLAEARALAAGLLRETALELAGRHAGYGLTGPVERGDAVTVQRHLESLANERSEDQALYRAMSRAILRLAEEEGRLTPDRAARIASLLDAG
ncbi:MAG: Rossmann-like and DUF2520 domain-containing protein [Xanthomonadales bacterium]|nr:Rossmann-like and DUF2520 domain-containing protein [Xanthomonadales bacterium]